jgi:hypothetical protein
VVESVRRFSNALRTRPKIGWRFRVATKSPVGGAVYVSFHLAATNPLIDRFPIETPVEPDAKSGQLAVLQQTINGSRMYPQIARQLSHSEDAIWTTFI